MDALLGMLVCGDTEVLAIEWTALFVSSRSYEAEEAGCMPYKVKEMPGAPGAWGRCEVSQLLLTGLVWQLQAMGC